jgi:DNA-binding transcriptional LysR family regulator
LLCPRVKLDVVLTNRRPDLLENGFDVAFRLGNMEQTNLISRPLLAYPLTMCASPQYLARRGNPQKPEDLQHHDCLSFAYPAGDDWHSVEKVWRLIGPEGEVAVAVSGPMLINSSAGLHQAARTGMGIVLLPDALVEQDLKDGKLLAVMPDYLPPSRPMSLMYAQDRYRLPKLRSFVDFAMLRWGKH